MVINWNSFDLPHLRSIYFDIFVFISILFVLDQEKLPLMWSIHLYSYQFKFSVSFWISSNFSQPPFLFKCFFHPLSLSFHHCFLLRTLFFCYLSTIYFECYKLLAFNQPRIFHFIRWPPEYLSVLQQVCAHELQPAEVFQVDVSGDLWAYRNAWEHCLQGCEFAPGLGVMQ